MLLKASPRLPERSARMGKPTNIVLETDDLDGECACIESRGGRVIVPPKRAGWGRAMEAHFTDPPSAMASC
jgi:predicted enzyme related to lactoylglutathione lyase